MLEAAGVGESGGWVGRSVGGRVRENLTEEMTVTQVSFALWESSVKERRWNYLE